MEAADETWNRLNLLFSQLDRVYKSINYRELPISADALRRSSASHWCYSQSCGSLVRNHSEARAGVDYKRGETAVHPHVHIGASIRSDSELYRGRTRPTDLVQVNSGELPVELDKTSNPVSSFGISPRGNAEEPLIRIRGFSEKLEPRGSARECHKIIGLLGIQFDRV